MEIEEKYPSLHYFLHTIFIRNLKCYSVVPKKPYQLTWLLK